MTTTRAATPKVVTSHYNPEVLRFFGVVAPQQRDTMQSSKRIEVLLDDLTHELKRLNDHLEELNDDEVHFHDEYR